VDRDAVTSPSVDVERRRVAVRRLGASVVAIALAGACASPTTSTPDHLVTIDRKHDVIVITNATVFPATATSGFDRLVGFDVVVAGGKIVSLTPSRGRGVVVAAPRDAVVIDGTGKTLLPGLVDAHVHVSNTGAPPWRDSSVAISAAHNLEAYPRSTTSAATATISSACRSQRPPARSPGRVCFTRTTRSPRRADIRCR
jgi:hypothetical protein